MAFLVCYSETTEDHARERAAYLPQAFYELIFEVCRDEGSGYPVLGEMARLRYDGPAMQVGPDRLPQLMVELRNLGTRGRGAVDLLAAAEEAKVRGCSLTISGDMHPELEDRRRPWWRFW